MLLFVAVLCLGWRSDCIQPLASNSNLPVHGAIYKQKLYGFFGEGESMSAMVALSVKDPNKGKWQGSESILFRPRVVVTHGILWHPFDRARLVRMPISDMHFFDSSDPKAMELYRHKYPSPDVATSMTHMWPLPTLGEKYWKILRAEGFTGDMEPKGVAGLDFVPTSENSCRVFFLPKQSGLLETWEMQTQFDVKNNTWRVVADHRTPETFKAPFSESFFAFNRNKDYYFVTQSGKLYIAAVPVHGEKIRKIKAIWEHSNCPIIAIIEDADRDQVWLFARSKNPNLKLDVFFEMKETTRAQSFDPAKLRPVNVEGRAKALLEYLPLISGKDKK